MTALPNRRARRASVLVLVMTLLGILFVVGVAFLATMNFEADMISAEKQRAQSDGGVDAAVESVGSVIRNAVMASPGVPFGDSSMALSGSAFAEMPGVQNTFSPIEPIRRLGPDQLPFTPDDSIVFGGYYDAGAHANGSLTNPTQIPGFYIDTQAPNGAQVYAYTVVISNSSGGPPTQVTKNLMRCTDGPFKGQDCTVPADCQTTPGPALYSCEGQGLADADGDGIVDSLLVDAKSMGLSDAQLADLAVRVNPASNLTGKVSVALRVVPHGGMVNLNDSHPTLIQNVLDLPPGYWPAATVMTPEPESGFRHGPTQRGTAYSSAMEEPLLRRRSNIPPREFQPSLLHGNPVPGSTSDPDMGKFLFWRDWNTSDKFQDIYTSASGTTARGHRFTPFSAGELVSQFSPDVPYWSAMMDPSTADYAGGAGTNPWNPAGTNLVYDRRHLVTTVSYDDLLARPGTVTTSRGKQDLRQVAIEANWSNFDPDMCLPLMPFEYANYPATADEQRERANYSKTCCPDDPNCRPDALRGRLQLSLPWLDDQLAAANSTTLTTQQQDEYRQRIFHIIHDVFYLLVRNATQATEVEGMTCSVDQDCPISDTVCRLNGAVPPASATGYCVHRGNPLINTFAGCAANLDCAMPGSVCRSDGICTLTAPAWRDVECPTNACDSGEFCMIHAGATVGVCADLWTRMPRSQALVARTAASLTANMIDFADKDDIPTPVAIRNFEPITKCNAGANQYLPCASDTDCPGGTCMNLFGRDIDLDATKAGVQGVYVFGLERHPYISEVATLFEPPAGADLAARAIEIFNPYATSILAGDASTHDEYFLYEIDPAAPLGGAHVVRLDGLLQGNNGLAPGPFMTFYWEAQPNKAKPLLGVPVRGIPSQVSGPGGLRFQNGWILYLTRRVQYSTGTTVDIVVDQFEVRSNPGNGNIGNTNPTPLCDIAVHPDGCYYSVERLVQQQTPWTAPVPWTAPETEDATTLSTWNGVVNGAIHPVEIEFANTGLFGAHFGSTVNASFPTTGSLSLLLRNADRAITDFAPPAIGGIASPVRNLAFNTVLNAQTDAKFRAESPVGSGSYQNIETLIEHSHQIDNGRMPLFDVGLNGQSAHHLSPALFKPWDPTNSNPNGTNKGLPGDSNMLPWGQLLFDYFTALPVSNGGPYDFDTAGNYLSIRDMPRVDEGGLRVHGRININAAPWKVLAGLPLVPMTNPPGTDPTVTLAGLPLSYQNKIAPVSNEGRIGPELAQAIVAYRDARALTDSTSGAVLTGNYDDGTPLIGTPPNTQSFGRGWTNPAPSVRRGTGFMSVGELANVRHPGAVAGLGLIPSSYRIDSNKIDLDANNNNGQDFIDAAAVLIALGDWVSVRSHVFTVYGQIRGADDPNVAALYTNPAQQAAALIQDTDARAIRFQETIDRLPVLQGQSRPRRIGERTVGRYTDVNND